MTIFFIFYKSCIKIFLKWKLVSIVHGKLVITFSPLDFMKSIIKKMCNFHEVYHLNLFYIYMILKWHIKIQKKKKIIPIKNWLPKWKLKYFLSSSNKNLP